MNIMSGAAQKSSIDSPSAASSEVVVSADSRQNKCPHLVALDVVVTVADDHYANVDLTIEFSEYTSGITGGVCRFSLKRAELQFNLASCQMPVDVRSVVTEITPRLTSAREVTLDANSERTEESRATRGGGLTVSATPGGSISQTESAKEVATTGEKRAVVDKFNTDLLSISSGGGAGSPHWIFVPMRGQDRLLGYSKSRSWGLLELQHIPASFEAVVKITKRDIGVVPVEMWLPLELSQKFQRVLTALALRQLDYKPFVSRVCYSFFRSKPAET